MCVILQRSATSLIPNPYLAETLSGPFVHALASNGDSVNYAQVRKMLENEQG